MSRSGRKKARWCSIATRRSRGSESELARVPVVPRDEDASRFFSVRGELFDSSGQSLGVERAMLGYVKDELTEVLLVFDAAWPRTSDCGEGRRCQAGSCVGSCVDPSPGRPNKNRSRAAALRALRRQPLRTARGRHAVRLRKRPLASGSCVIARPVRSVALGHPPQLRARRRRTRFTAGAANDVGQLGPGAQTRCATSPTFVLEITTFWRGIHTKATRRACSGATRTRDCWGETGPVSSATAAIGPAARRQSTSTRRWCAS